MKLKGDMRWAIAMLRLQEARIHLRAMVTWSGGWHSFSRGLMYWVRRNHCWKLSQRRRCCRVWCATKNIRSTPGMTAISCMYVDARHRGLYQHGAEDSKRA